MAEKRKLLRVTTASAWRTWLRKNHARAKDVWFVFAKAGSGKPRVTYAEALEEALCFGWIDTTVQRLDEHYYIQRFTPRSNPKNWSKVNLDKFDRLEREGRMTDAGRAKRPADVKPPPPRLPVSSRVRPLVAQALAAHPRAQRFFDTLAPGYRRDYLRWITEAKKEETRERRLKEAIRRLELGWKTAFDAYGDK